MRNLLAGTAGPAPAYDKYPRGFPPPPPSRSVSKGTATALPGPTPHPTQRRSRDETGSVLEAWPCVSR